MKRYLYILTSLVLIAGSLFLGRPQATAQAKSPKILTFNTMVGIPQTLTGTQSQVPLRGITGGGLPWMISSGSGELFASGHLKIIVQGLVLAAGPKAGTNPIPSFGALVSCVKSDGSFDNILTAAFPATTGSVSSGGGDAEIETDVSLPQPCIAPIVFVTNPGGAWFAATGN